MTSARPRLSRVSSAIALAALAAASAAAQSNTYLALGDSIPSASGSDRGQHIDVLSYSWGSTQAKGKVEHEWKVEEGESAPPRPPRPSDVTMRRGTSAGDPDRPVLTGSVPNPSDPASGQASGSADRGGEALDRPTFGQTFMGGLKKYGSVEGAMTSGTGANETVTVGANRTPSAKADNKLQEVRSRAVADISQDGPSMTARLRQPLAKGSVWIRVATPWAGCRVGARYPTVRLGTGDRVYTLTGVVVAGCPAASSGDSAPSEHISLNYAKIVWK